MITARSDSVTCGKSSVPSAALKQLGCSEIGQDVRSVFFSSRRRHTRYWRDWSSDVCSSDLNSTDGSVRYNDFFLQEFLPHIERTYRIALGRGARAISGISMGGYGALRFAFEIGRASCRERV